MIWIDTNSLLIYLSMIAYYDLNLCYQVLLIYAKADDTTSLSLLPRQVLFSFYREKRVNMFV